MRRSLLLVSCLLALSCAARAAIVYVQPHDGSGTLHQSSWMAPDGYDADIYGWEDFILGSNTAITEIRWRGGFMYGGVYGGPVVNFTVAIYANSIANEPDVVHPPIVQYETNNNAGQTLAGVFGGLTMYDYRFALPSPFQATANTRYWVYILAWQHGVPEWGLAHSATGSNHYFRRLSDYLYQWAPGDWAMTLHAADAPGYTINASAQPAGSGTIVGAGVYPSGSQVTLQANANNGWGFINWTESGTQVSGSATYSFTATRDRTLVAHFVPAYTVTTSALPLAGGTASGDGTFNSGSTVTVTANANPGFVFSEWTEFGGSVSTNATYSFTIAANRTLVANFAVDTQSVLFDFDNAPVHTSLPLNLTVSGLSAYLTATGPGYSIQPADTLGFTPAGFSGLCIYPNSVFPADLLVAFSDSLTDFSIMYSPQELGCDDSATMRITAFQGVAPVGTNTATAPQPGTWPTGTLSIHVAGGFDNVVVHYEHRPPTCQDYGVIFLADNMVVTRVACTAVSVTQEPVPALVCSADSMTFFVGTSGSGTIGYRWQAELDPGVWTDLADGNLVHNTVMIANVSGPQTDTVTFSGLANFRSDRAALNLRCNVSNSCGNATSTTATLSVALTGDANCDGVVDNSDIDPFVLALLDPAGYAAGYPACSPCTCDTNQDGVVDNSDIDSFVTCLLSGCP